MPHLIKLNVAFSLSLQSSSYIYQSYFGIHMIYKPFYFDSKSCMLIQFAYLLFAEKHLFLFYN